MLGGGGTVVVVALVLLRDGRIVEGRQELQIGLGALVGARIGEWLGGVVLHSARCIGGERGRLERRHSNAARDSDPALEERVATSS